MTKGTSEYVCLQLKLNIKLYAIVLTASGLFVKHVIYLSNGTLYFIFPLSRLKPCALYACAFVFPRKINEVMDWRCHFLPILLLCSALNINYWHCGKMSSECGSERERERKKFKKQQEEERSEKNTNCGKKRNAIKGGSAIAASRCVQSLCYEPVRMGR